MPIVFATPEPYDYASSFLAGARQQQEKNRAYALQVREQQAKEEQQAAQNQIDIAQMQQRGQLAAAEMGNQNQRFMLGEQFARERDATNFDQQRQMFGLQDSARQDAQLRSQDFQDRMQRAEWTRADEQRLRQAQQGWGLVQRLWDNREIKADEYERARREYEQGIDPWIAIREADRFRREREESAARQRKLAEDAAHQATVNGMLEQPGITFHTDEQGNRFFRQPDGRIEQVRPPAGSGSSGSGSGESGGSRPLTAATRGTMMEQATDEVRRQIADELRVNPQRPPVTTAEREARIQEEFNRREDQANPGNARSRMRGAFDQAVAQSGLATSQVGQGTSERASSWGGNVQARVQSGGLPAPVRAVQDAINRGDLEEAERLWESPEAREYLPSLRPAARPTQKDAEHMQRVSEQAQRVAVRLQAQAGQANAMMGGTLSPDANPNVADLQSVRRLQDMAQQYPNRAALDRAPLRVQREFADLVRRLSQLVPAENIQVGS